MQPILTAREWPQDLHTYLTFDNWFVDIDVKHLAVMNATSWY